MASVVPGGVRRGGDHNDAAVVSAVVSAADDSNATAATDADPSIAVVGGGVAGLIAAEVLRQAGVDVTIFERFAHDYTEESSETNGALALADNGMNIVKLLGFEEVLKKGTCRWNNIFYFNGVATTPSHALHVQHDVFSIGRSTLLRGLSHRLVATGVVQFGRRVARVEQADTDGTDTDGPATLHFDDGTAESFDIVIGADGIRSTVNQHLSPHATSAEAFSGVCAFYGTVPAGTRFTNPHLVDGNSTLHMTMPLGTVFSYCGMEPTKGNVPERHWHIDVVTTEDDTRQAFPSSWKPGTPRQDRRAQLQHLTRGLGADHPLLELIAKTPDHLLKYFPLRVRSTRPKRGWFRGSCVLVGDALHHTLPYLGQGANQAMEDGFVLAQCLLANRLDRRRAYARYFQLRHRRVARVIRAAQFLSFVRLRLPVPLAILTQKVLRAFGILTGIFHEAVRGMPVSNDGTVVIDAECKEHLHEKEEEKKKQSVHRWRKLVVAAAAVATAVGCCATAFSRRG